MTDSSPPDRASVPQALSEVDQWVCWRGQERDGKPTKVPIEPGTGEYASTTDPETWTSFGDARKHALEKEAAAIGFVFTDGDPFVGVDLDDCRVPETGTVSKWATDIIGRLDSYTERSPSGTGFHVIVAGTLPDGRNRKGDVELYDRARFFTMTGDHLADTPTHVRERSRELAAVHETYVATEPSDSDSDPNDASATTESAGGGTRLRFRFSGVEERGYAVTASSRSSRYSCSHSRRASISRSPRRVSV